MKMDAQTEGKLTEIMWVIANTCELSEAELRLLCWATGTLYPPQPPVRDEVAYEIKEMK
jgi:hypothetical protein